MRGNRDFLLGKGFTERSGVELLDDPAVVDLYGTGVLLTHGDLLCTDDTDYQSFRREVREVRWQQEFLARPLDQRRRLAAGMRDASRAANQEKAQAIMDVAPAAVLDMLQRHDVRWLIHGHTHRPAIHEFEHRDHAARRMVLGDWYTAGNLLECTPQGCRLESPLLV
jgi:UDP-2,3-diacylglucosamine hydrolase